MNSYTPEQNSTISAVIEHSYFSVEKVEDFPELATAHYVIRLMANNAVRDVPNYEDFVSDDMVLGKVDAYLVVADDKGAYSKNLDGIIDFGDFAGREAIINAKPNERILFIYTLNVYRQLGRKLGHRLIEKMEEVTSPDRSILYCFPIGTAAMIRMSTQGIEHLENYYADAGFTTIHNDIMKHSGNRYPLMEKARKRL